MKRLLVVYDGALFFEDTGHYKLSYKRDDYKNAKRYKN